MSRIAYANLSELFSVNKGVSIEVAIAKQRITITGHNNIRKKKAICLGAERVVWEAKADPNNPDSRLSVCPSWIMF